MTKTFLIVFALCSTYLVSNHVNVMRAPVSVVNSPTIQAVTKTQDEQEKLKKLARKKFMQGKLVSNKKIVQGLTTNDFGLVKEGAQEVSAYVKGQSWFVLKTPEYRVFSDDMSRAAKSLERAAKNQNVEAAALRYFELTVKCIDCHQYILTTKY